MKRGDNFPAGNPEKAPDPWIEVDFDPSASFGEEIIVPSSAAQREIFSPSLMDADASRAYNHSISVHFEGPLDVDAIHSALWNLIQRHEALRGRFSADGTSFRVAPGLAFALPIIDLTGLSEAARKLEYKRLVIGELDHVFDLVRGPLFRSALFHQSEDRWTLVFTCHHAIVDGWSLKIILGNLVRFYNALANSSNRQSPLRPLPPAPSFVEYLSSVVGLENSKSGEVKAYWKRVYRDGVPVLDLPLDHPRPAQRSYRSKRVDYPIRREIFDRLKETGAKLGASAFITLLSSFALFLHRISSARELVVGVPAAGQIKLGKSELLGHDARLLPLKTRLDPGDTFLTFSARAMEAFFAAYEHQWISMPELIAELGLRTEADRVPLVPVLFNFDPGLKADELKCEGVKAHHFFNHRNFETFELSINAVVEDGELVLECAYNADLFEEETVIERLGHFETLMSSISRSPGLPIAQLELVTAGSIENMDRALNRTQMDYEPTLRVDELIRRAVMRSPAAIAVEFEEKSLTYEETWEKSGRVAAAILRLSPGLGLGRNPLIGVLFERSEFMVPVLLGIWRAGAAFVPLDPHYPKERLEYIVEHSGIRLVLSTGSLKGTLACAGLHYLDIADCLEAHPDASVALPSRTSEDLAYVIYTSGSTGRPKGVQVPHRALNNFLCAMRVQPGLRPDDRLLAVTTLSFDIAELELWLPLVSGARTVIVDRNTAIDGQALIDAIRDKGITFIQATPATWRLLLALEWEGNPTLTALCGGEALPNDLAEQLREKVGTLWNMYGPTETTVWSTLDRAMSGPVTIGKPIGNTQCYILDAAGQWVPRGVVGELWIGGEGVARGYLGRDDLTAERFVPNRLTGKGLIYKTGDLVRLRMDGRIEHLGRNDFQVKVRGYRIELGEIQAALARHPAIQECVVCVKEKAPGDALLVAYYCLKSGKKVGFSELKSTLKETLPDYMVPSYFFGLGRLPLTPNGKIDLQALVAMPISPGGSSIDKDHHPPRTSTEVYLAQLWSEALDGVRVSRTARFFELGGSSLLAVQLIHRLKTERGWRLSPKQILLKSLEQIASELGGETPRQDPTQLPVKAMETAARPGFFGSPEKRKFSCFHPGGRSAPFGVLICPPLGQEYMRTHWLIRNLSSALQQRGLPVLRFDYYGQGDSSGATGHTHLSDLRESAEEAVHELRAASGVRAIKVVAFRTSALIVAEIPALQGDAGDVLLVEPVYSGRAHLDMLRSVQRRRWSAYPHPKRWIDTRKQQEVLGHLHPADWIRDMESLTLGPARFRAMQAPVPPGWDDFRRIEEMWLSPQLVRSIERWVLGELP